MSKTTERVNDALGLVRSARVNLDKTVKTTPGLAQNPFLRLVTLQIEAAVVVLEAVSDAR